MFEISIVTNNNQFQIIVTIKRNCLRLSPRIKIRMVVETTT